MTHGAYKTHEAMEHLKLIKLNRNNKWKTLLFKPQCLMNLILYFK